MRAVDVFLLGLVVFVLFGAWINLFRRDILIRFLEGPARHLDPLTYASKWWKKPNAGLWMTASGLIGLLIAAYLLINLIARFSE